MKKSSKVTVDDKLIFSSEKIFPNNKNIKDLLPKVSQIGKKCVTLNNMIEYHIKETDISELIRKNHSELSGNMTRTIFDKS